MADEVKPQIFIENFSIKEINRSICISSFWTRLITVIVTVSHLAVGMQKGNYWQENKLISCFY